MSANYTHDLAIKTGEYTDAQGQTKKRWLNVGKVFKHDDGGASIKLDALPVLAGWDGWISVFPRRERNDQGGRQGQGEQTPHRGSGGSRGWNEAEGEDIPFAPLGHGGSFRVV